MEQKEERAECLTNILHHLQQTDEQQFLILLYLWLCGEMYFYLSNMTKTTIRTQFKDAIRIIWRDDENIHNNID